MPHFLPTTIYYFFITSSCYFFFFASLRLCAFAFFSSLLFSSHLGVHVEYSELKRTYSVFRSVVQWVAEPGPKPTCRSIEVSLLDRIDSLTTLASNSKGSPASNNGMELIFSAVRLGWIGTPAKPAAETMRPQFGSPPVIAVLTKLLSAMLRAIASASAWVLAPWTQISIRCVAPSPSSGIIFARSMHS